MASMVHAAGPVATIALPHDAEWIDILQLARLMADALPLGSPAPPTELEAFLHAAALVNLQGQLVAAAIEGKLPVRERLSMAPYTPATEFHADRASLRTDELGPFLQTRRIALRIGAADMPASAAVDAPGGAQMHTAPHASTEISDAPAAQPSLLTMVPETPTIKLEDLLQKLRQEGIDFDAAAGAMRHLDRYPKHYERAKPQGTPRGQYIEEEALRYLSARRIIPRQNRMHRPA